MREIPKIDMHMVCVYKNNENNWFCVSFLVIHRTHNQNKESKTKKKKSSSAAVAVKEVKRESTLHILYSTLDSRRNFLLTYATLVVYRSLYWFVWYWFVRHENFSDTFLFSCLWMSFICMAIFSFFLFSFSLWFLSALWLLLLFLIMQRSATKWENAEEYTFVHSHSTLFSSLSLSFLFLCNANKTVTHLKMSKVQGFSVKKRKKNGNNNQCVTRNE